jgi:hypothetical protein
MIFHVDDGSGEGVSLQNFKSITSWLVNLIRVETLVYKT